MILGIGLGLAIVAGSSGGGASAMTSDVPPVRCSVERADMLPSGLTADAICDAIRRAVAPAMRQAALAPADLAVRVTVKSSAMLTAGATISGKALPEHHLSNSDRPLNERAVGMLASAIAADIASARR